MGGGWLEGFRELLRDPFRFEAFYFFFSVGFLGYDVLFLMHALILRQRGFSASGFSMFEFVSMPRGSDLRISD